MNAFDQWWEKRGWACSLWRRKEDVAKEAWNAAIAFAAEHVVPGGDREVIKSLKTCNEL